MKLIFSFIFLPVIFSTHISIPFIKEFPNFNENYLFDNNILAQLSLGTPKVNVNFLFDFNSRLTYVPDISLGGLYSNNSKTYKFVEDPKGFYQYGSKYFSYCFSQENFYIQEKLIENFNFNYLYTSRNNGTLKYGVLGFQAPVFKDEKNFKYQLKKNGLTDDHIFQIHYLNENSGEIIIGTKPYNSNYIEVITSFEYGYKNIFIKFEKIIYNDIEEKNPRIIMNYNLRGIIVKNSYFNLINETFFFPLVEKKKCKYEYMNYTDNKYIYFVCDEDIDTKNFKELNILNTKLNYTFKLTHKDLFKVYNKKKYCLVFHDLSSPTKWSLGQIFFEKYPMIINEESKIAIYQFKNNNNYFIIVVIILLIGLLIIIIILSFVIVKLIKNKPRRIRANELEDENYDYKPLNLNLI